jgi:hypothetical protein
MPSEVPNHGGRPTQHITLSANAARGQQIKAANVEAVCQFMQTKGFRSPREFMREFLSNPKCFARQTGFYKEGGGFEEVVGLMLNDKRGGMANRLHPTVLDWIYTRGEHEYDTMICSKALGPTLRYSKSDGRKGMAPASLAQFRRVVSQHAPMVWGLINRLATKDRYRDEAAFLEDMHIDADTRTTLIPLTAAMSLLFARNQQCNMYQVLFSVLYYSHGLEKRAREVLTGQGLMISAPSTTNMLREMAAGVRQHLRDRARTVPQLISIDNVNQKTGVRHATLHAKAHIDNSTAGYAVDMAGRELLPAGKIGIPVDWWDRGARRLLDPMAMLPGRSSVNYIMRQTPVMLTDILGRCIHGFAPNRGQYFPRVPVQKLQPNESRQFTSFELMSFDQGTVDGNGASLTHAATIECGYAPDMLEQILVLVSGDQLTMDRIRSLRLLRADGTYGSRFNWILPLMGFFHLAMNFLKIFLKNHLGSPNDPASLAGCNAVLRREHVDDKVSDFWSVLDLVDDSLDSFVLDMVIEEAGVASLDDLTAFLVHDTQCPHPRWPEIIAHCATRLRPDSVAQLRRADEDQRDVVRENALLFVRHALGFRDFWLACKHGDIGRCMYMLDLWWVRCVEYSLCIPSCVQTDT